MSAQPKSIIQPLGIVPMQVVDVDAICRVEQSIYAFPWTRGNFIDSLQSGYSGWVIWKPDEAAGPDPTLIGYAMTMKLPDEIHLLNITVASNFQGQGIGRSFIRWLLALARNDGASGMLLEVRPSNPGAIALYQAEGFVQVGLRKGYYPASNNQREDALVFSLSPL
jgi:[ribosomal protein S18]-alanine N-acetyltransferase